MSTWRDDRKRYKRYKARTRRLPASHRGAVDAVQRYALRFGPGTGPALLTMLEDLVGIFERGVEDGTPAHRIVGDDPVRFTEDFLTRYPTNPWTAQEQHRLAHTLDHAARAEA